MTFSALLSAYCFETLNNSLIPENGKRSAYGHRKVNFTLTYTCHEGFEYNDPVSVAANGSSDLEDDFLVKQRRVQCQEKDLPEYGGNWVWLDGGPPTPCYRKDVPYEASIRHRSKNQTIDQYILPIPLEIH